MIVKKSKKRAKFQIFKKITSIILIVYHRHPQRASKFHTHLNFLLDFTFMPTDKDWCFQLTKHSITKQIVWDSYCLFQQMSISFLILNNGKFTHDYFVLCVRISFVGNKIISEIIKRNLMEWIISISESQIPKFIILH